MKNSVKSALILVLTALIWGIAFVAQSTGGDAIGAYSFTCIRSFIGAIVLLPVIRLLDHLGFTRNRPETKEQWKQQIKAGIACGCCLCFASMFQQLGINAGTEAGKAGFLTACYIVLVPIFGIFLKKRCGWNVWLAVIVSVIGLYLLCITDGFSIRNSDILVVICAFLFALHILTIDHFADKVDVVRMSCIQFLTAGVISLIPMFIVDMRHGTNMMAWCQPFGTSDAWIPLLYAGIMSSGVAYTLQCIGQQGINPTAASLIMSLESVFSVLAGWVLLQQHLSVRELCGCVLIFIAVVAAQIPVPEIRHKKKA